MATATAVALVLSGCKTQPPAPAAAGPTAFAGPPYIVLSPNQRVGSVVWVEATGESAVIELDPHLALAPEGLLVARGEDFTPHAVLRLSGTPRGRFYPVEVLAGECGTEDEVVAPGPELRDWGEALMSAGAR